MDDHPRGRYLQGVSQRIVIIGASYAGMCTALALCCRGFDSHIVERSASPSRRGSGVVVQPRMEEYLRRNGLESKLAIGVAPRGRRVYHRDGSVESLPGDGSYYTGWDTLLNRLEASLPATTIERGKALQRLMIRANEVEIHFTDETSQSSDIVVGADGIGSRTRQILDPEAVPVDTGYVAYRGVAPVSRFASEIRESLGGYFNVLELPAGQFLSYPISSVRGGTAEKERRVNWVWYVPDSVDAKESLRDRDGVLHRSTVAPGFMRDDVRRHIVDHARRTFPPAFEALVRETPDPFVQRVVDLAPRRMVYGRAVLVGDAASIVRPHTGSGTAKAVEDAVRLADYLSEKKEADGSKDGGSECSEIEKRLEDWEQERIVANRGLVERGRHLAREFGIDE